MRQHGGEHVVDQAFLQLHVALRHAFGDGFAHEVVVDHFFQLVILGRRQGQGNVQVDVDEDALLALFLEVVDADVDEDFVIAQEQAAAIGQARVVQGGRHSFTF